MRRARVRSIAEGSSALSPGELLAIILRVGGQGENAIAMANRLLAQFGGLTGLVCANVDELCSAHGMGEAKATQIQRRRWNWAVACTWPPQRIALASRRRPR